MKPLSEWATEDLREWIECCRSRLGRTAADVLAELLRRERERCADKCEQVGGEYRYDYAESAYRAATAIRGMQ